MVFTRFLRAWPTSESGGFAEEVPCVAWVHVAQAEQGQEVSRVEIGIPRGRAADFCAKTQIAFDERRGGYLKLLVQAFDGQRQAWEGAVFDGGQVRMG